MRRRSSVAFLAGLGIVVLVSALVGMVVAIQGHEHHQHPPVTTSVSVTDSASLSTAFEQATDGEVISMEPGNYDELRLTDRHWDPPVTLQSADAANQVTLPNVSLTSTSGLTIRNIRVDKALEARDSSELDIDHNSVGGGVMLRDGIADVNITNNQLHGGRFGVWIHSTPGSNASPNNRITVSNNDVAEQTGDNIQIGSADDIVVSDNVIHDIPDNPDHNDGIQVMGGRNVTIDRNRFWNQDQAILLKAEPDALGPATVVDGATVSNNLVTRERGAGVIVAGADNVSIVNNTGADNRYADVHLENSNPGLKVWNNVVRQIFAKDPQSQGYEWHNCVEVAQQTGDGDVHAAASFVDRTWYKLVAGSACTTAATSTNAPKHDLQGSVRGQRITAGAWE